LVAFQDDLNLHSRYARQSHITAIFFGLSILYAARQLGLDRAMVAEPTELLATGMIAPPRSLSRLVTGLVWLFGPPMCETYELAGARRSRPPAASTPAA